MKTALLAIVILVVLSADTQAFELQARTYQTILNHSELRSNTGAQIENFEVRAIHKGLFGYGSVDSFGMFGQEIEMYSFGLGYQQPIVEGVHVYLKVGYDMPNYDSGGFCWEPIWFYQVQYLSPPYGNRIFHHYTAEIDPSFTGELGIDYKRNIYNGLSLGLFGAWKVAKHLVSAYGLEPDGIPGKTGWQVVESWDFGGYKVGVLAEWEF